MNSLVGNIYAGNPASVDDRNNWQCVSDATGHIVAPAMGVTAAGTWLTLDGIDHAGTYRGAAEQIIGRGLDMVDGWVARATETASDEGEAFDAGTDAVEVLYAGTKKSTYENLTKPESVWFVSQKLANIFATGVAKARGNEIHPTKTGKHTSAALSVTYFGRSLAKAFETHGRYLAADRAHNLARRSTRISVALGIPATLGYFVDAGMINGKPAEVINFVNDAYADTVNSAKDFAIKGIHAVAKKSSSSKNSKPPITNQLLD